jgi:hypothetical protein
MHFLGGERDIQARIGNGEQVTELCQCHGKFSKRERENRIF